MIVVTIEVGLLAALEDSLKSRELAHLFCAEVSWLVEHETVAVAKNVGREPAVQAEATSADDRSET